MLAQLDASLDVSTVSSEYRLMADSWSMISDILEGTKAIRARALTYLPRYEMESTQEYDRRLKTSPWRPEFADALRGLASKPFGKDVALGAETPEPIKTVAEDVDARGNNLTAFAREAFQNGIAKGMHAVLVDYPAMAPGSTIAAERASGARPYWVHVPADNIIALYTEVVAGREIVSHVRIKESASERDGYSEITVQRVRVLEPGRWELWEKRPNDSVFVKVGEGRIDRGGKTGVPLVLFYTGERKGEVLVKPPLLDLAHMQIELYRALSRQDEILTFAGAPMLAAIGFAPPSAESGSPQIEVGPKRVLFAPPSAAGGATGWEFVQPAAANITEIRAHVTSIIDDMRRLGMQPLMQRSGTPTATGQSIEAAKAHSAVQAWALGLKDALEQAMVFTAEWMGLPDAVELDVSTDFSVQPYADAPLQALDKARARRDISLRTFHDGLRRFDVLSPGFDHVEEETAIAAELKAVQATAQIDPLTGQPIVVPKGAVLA